MTCQLPPPLSDDEISAVLDGTAEGGVIQHVALCPDCAGRVADARRLEAVLFRHLSRWDCPTAQTLGEYSLHLLPEDDARRVAEHVAGCAACQVELSELDAYLAGNSEHTAPAPDPSPGVRRRLLPQTLLGTVLMRRPTAALRGPGDEPVIVEADGMTVYLRADAGAGRSVLLGQLAGDALADWVGALVQLRQDGALRQTTEIDQFGSFRCEGFALRPFELQIAARGGSTLLIPQISLTE
ncbi:MAG: hypothetical protein LC121_12235 [Anaerolineae bacterium]|nr:hypothetical protein [Anaerolineae bacterium]